MTKPSTKCIVASLIMVLMSFEAFAQAPIPKPVILVVNTIAGHEYVDLGLSVKWATCNVGANCPEDYGRYFAWGETAAKSEYTTQNSETNGKELGDIFGNSAYDAARAIWGSTWRMPKEAEFQELIDNCTWTWTTYNGKKGFMVVSKKNNNSIFLPAAGRLVVKSLDGEEDCGYYWSSTSCENDSKSAICLDCFQGNYSIGHISRGIGQSIRPVSE